MNIRLRELIADTLGIPADSIHPELLRKQEDAWDSLGHLRLVTAIEQAFGIRMSMEEIQGAHGVADLVKLLEQRGIAQ